MPSAATPLFNNAVSTEISEVSAYITEFSKSGYPNLGENATLSERLIYGLKICGLGMLIVFGVLIALAAVLYLFKLYHVISTKKTAIAEPKTDDNRTDTVGVSASEENEEIIAALATAAIAASRNDSDAAFKIKSIKKIN